MPLLTRKKGSNDFPMFIVGKESGMIISNYPSKSRIGFSPIWVERKLPQSLLRKNLKKNREENPLQDIQGAIRKYPKISICAFADRRGSLFPTAGIFMQPSVA